MQKQRKYLLQLISSPISVGISQPRGLRDLVTNESEFQGGEDMQSRRQWSNKGNHVNQILSTINK